MTVVTELLDTAEESLGEVLTGLFDIVPEDVQPAWSQAMNSIRAAKNRSLSASEIETKVLRHCRLCTGDAANSCQIFLATNSCRFLEEG